MMIREFRIPVPLSAAEYRIALLYCTLKNSLFETGGGEGVEFVVNREHAEGGQYTKKIYHIDSQVPTLLRRVAPTKALELHEESVNKFPVCTTVIRNPQFSRKKFLIRVETKVMDNDCGELADVFSYLTEEGSSTDTVDVVNIDIANDPVNEEDFEVSEDPSTFRTKSLETPRGPLGANWISQCRPICCVYKCITVTSNQWPITHRLEKKIMSIQERFMTVFHRRMFCWLDEYIELSIDDIRQLESETMEELERRRKQEGKPKSRTKTL